MKRSSISTKVITASCLFVATTGVVFARHYATYHEYINNYKGEANYKAEPDVVPCPEPNVLRDGLYLGAQAGYDSYRVYQNTAFPGASGHATSNATGWVGGLFAGYGQTFQHLYYVAGEVFGNYSGAQVGNLTNIAGPNHYSANFTARGSFGLAVLPGLKLNDTLLAYVRLGYSWAQLKSRENTAFSSDSRSSTSNGFAYGLGMESYVYCNWSARAEFIHTNYNSYSTALANFQPSDNQYLLGVLYHFEM